MKKRSPVVVFLLSFITFGLYYLYWLVVTKGELNKQGAKIPTAWLIIIPIVSIWWLWKYSEGVEQVTNEKVSGVLAFILLFLISFIGAAVIQSDYNKFSAVAATAQPAAPTGDAAAPTASPAAPEQPVAQPPAPPVETPAPTASPTPSPDTTPKPPAPPANLVQ